MTNKKTREFLITTPLKSTWKPFKKNIFLNYETIFEKKTIDKRKTYVYSKPFGVSLKEKLASQKYIHELSEEILKDLSYKLNEYHGLNLSARCWKIILGNCVRRIINIIFYRYKCLENVTKLKKNLVTTASNPEDYKLNTADSLNIDMCTQDDEWNYNLISNILRISFQNKIKLVHHKTKNNFYKNQFFKIEYSWFKKKIFYFINNLAKIFNKKKSYFIYRSYLDKFSETRLNFFLGQIPTFETLDKNQEMIPRYNKKKREILNLDKKKVTEIERVIRKLIPKIIPSCFLENFEILKKEAFQLPWPSNPRAIITANSYEFNELFKIWAAFKISEGSKYFIFQHGSLNSNSTLKEMTNEYVVCDKFFYWGKKFNNKKGIEAFNFKLFNKKTNFRKKNILVICKGKGHNNFSYDRIYEHKIIYENLIKFTKLLPKRILDNVYFRVRRDLKKNIEADYLISKKLNIVSNKENIFDLTRRKSLVIYFYNSTGVYENLTLNIPTMFLWSDSKNHLNSQNLDFINYCKKNKIFHNSAESLVNELILRYNNIDEWWKNDALQKSRKLMCEKYSIYPDNIKLLELSKKIKRASK